MAQNLTTSFVSTDIPGAYANVQVLTTPAGVGTAGIITIIGEASGGPSYEQDSVQLKNNFFTPSQAALVQQKYLSGNIVDAMFALTAPSADANIQGAPTAIYIIKTNTGSQAHSTVSNNLGTYGTLTDANYGLNGNNISYQVTASQLEVTPTVTSTTIPAFGAPLNGDSFSIRVNGAAAHVITLSGTAFGS